MKNKSSKVMHQLEKMGWVKNFHPALKGQYHFLPRGTMVFNSLAEFLKNWVKTELNSLEIRTPILYDWSSPSIQAESSQFEERVFQCAVDKKTAVLRPGGDYGVMSLLSQAALAESHLPISLFELATSFRKCQTRELSGLLKARAFTLLDHHTFASNPTQAWNAYHAIILAQAKLGDFFGFEWDLHLHIEKQFWAENLKNIARLEQAINKKIHLTLLEKPINYWITQHHFIDCQDGISFSDGQYDCVNAKNYTIEYKTSDGKGKCHPIICHGSFDSVERWIYKLVNRAINANGFNFPVWFAPIHVRCIVHSQKTLLAAQDIQKRATLSGIRVDIDSREKNNHDKINQALNDWIPFTLLFSNDFDTLDTSLLTMVTLDRHRTLWNINSFLESLEKKLAFYSFKETTLDSLLKKPALR